MREPSQTIRGIKMELILKTTVDNLGEEGDVVTVSPGYGRNYLIPQQMAVLATTPALKQLELEKDAIEARKQASREEAEELTKKLAGITVTISKRVGEEGKLYGSVNSSDIAEKLADFGINIDKRKIVLTEAIKSLGEVVVPVKTGYQSSGEIKVEIVPESE